MAGAGPAAIGASAQQNGLSQHGYGLCVCVVAFVCLYPRHGVADAVAAAVDVAPSAWLLLLLSLCLLLLLLLLMSLPRHGYTLVMALRVCW